VGGSRFLAERLGEEAARGPGPLPRNESELSEVRLNIGKLPISAKISDEIVWRILLEVTVRRIKPS
jgi:hypothetical protein